VPQLRTEDIARRRRLEDILIACGREREWLDYKQTINHGKVRALLAEARAAGITVRDISRMTGLSTQTLHTWMRRHMQLLPAVHYGLHDPPAVTLEEAALRTIGEEPDRDWLPEEVRDRIPTRWPNGTVEEVAEALEILTRTHQIWDGGADAYRLVPPPD
jgi:hypothetical protein